MNLLGWNKLSSDRPPASSRSQPSSVVPTFNLFCLWFGLRSSWWMTSGPFRLLTLNFVCFVETFGSCPVCFYRNYYTAFLIFTGIFQLRSVMIARSRKVTHVDEGVSFANVLIVSQWEAGLVAAWLVVLCCCCCVSPRLCSSGLQLRCFWAHCRLTSRKKSHYKSI